MKILKQSKHTFSKLFSRKFNTNFFRTRERKNIQNREKGKGVGRIVILPEGFWGLGYKKSCEEATVRVRTWHRWI